MSWELEYAMDVGGASSAADWKCLERGVPLADVVECKHGRAAHDRAPAICDCWKGELMTELMEAVRRCKVDGCEQEATRRGPYAGFCGEHKGESAFGRVDHSEVARQRHANGNGAGVQCEGRTALGERCKLRTLDGRLCRLHKWPANGRGTGVPGPALTDTQAVDALAAWLRDRDDWSGGDFCDFASTVVESTGRSLEAQFTAMIVVVRGGHQAAFDLSADALAHVEEVLFVGPPWKVEPSAVYDDADPEFDTSAAVAQYHAAMYPNWSGPGTESEQS